MEYKIIECESTKQTTEDVNLSIKDGWKPLGGVSITYNETLDFHTFVVAQAMVKK